MSERVRLPRWLGLANPVIVALQRRGVVIGTMRLLSVPGRKSGKLRTTPVSPLTVEGERYIIAGLEEADWVVGDPGARPRSRACKPRRIAAPGARPRLAGVPAQGASWGPVFSATLRYLRRSRRVRSAGIPMSGVPGGGGWAVI